MERFWLTNAGWDSVLRVAQRTWTYREQVAIPRYRAAQQENRKTTRRRVSAYDVRRQHSGWHVSPQQPTFADYEPCIRGLLEWLDTTSDLESWCEDARLIESLLADIAFEQDATSPTLYEAEPTTQEELEDQQALDSFIESIDHLDHGAFGDRLDHALYGRASGIVESTSSTGFAYVEDFTDAYDNPVMVASDHGTGTMVSIEAERTPTYRRLRDRTTVKLTVLGRESDWTAIRLLATLTQTRRWIEDQLLGLEEEGTPLPDQPVRTVNVNGQGLESLRREYAALRSRGQDTSDVERLGHLVKRELPRVQQAVTAREMRESVVIHCP